MNIDTIYTYFKVEPEVLAVLEVQGTATMTYTSDRIKIINTLSYPGLAIKGIAAVGPTLDLYAWMEATAMVSGRLTAGAKVTFPRYKVYFPQTKEAEEYQRWLLPKPEDAQRVKGPEMQPVLDASVNLTALFDFKVTPEVNLGIKVNSPLRKGEAIMDAQIAAFINNTIRFKVQAEASGGIGSGPAASYSVIVSYFYNFGGSVKCVCG
jgi:hypothetical protein